ncbi:MAG: hypothetical protein RQ714_07300 [Nitrosomonas sp.]|nr:hypothetical protein [Nitrosomonas sp.]
MNADRRCGVQALIRRLLAALLLAACSPALVAQLSIVTRSDQTGERNKPYRKTGSAESAAPFSEPITLPVNTCAMVEHIERIGMFNEIDGGADARIAGTIALPAGQSDNKTFYANVDIPANQGYRPPQRNIAGMDYFRIYLTTHDGGSHIITQPAPPEFMAGDTVVLKDSNLLEAANCMSKSE